MGGWRGLSVALFTSSGPFAARLAAPAPQAAASLTTVTVERGAALQFSAGSRDSGTFPDFFPLLFFSPPLLLLPQDLLERLGGVQHLSIEAGHDLMGTILQ